MKLLWGHEYRLWQTMRAEYARTEAMLTSAEHLHRVYEDTIKRLREEVAYYREKCDRAVDELLLTKGVQPIRPELPNTSEDMFVEDPAEVERLERLAAEHPAAAFMQAE